MWESDFKKTNFLTFCFYFKDLTEDLNTPGYVPSGCLTIDTLDFPKLCKYSPLLTWCPKCALLTLEMLFSCRTCHFRYCDNCCVHKIVITHTKHSKYTFVTLVKHFLQQNWIDDILASRYYVSIRRLFCFSKSTISNKLISS